MSWATQKISIFWESCFLLNHSMYLELEYLYWTQIFRVYASGPMRLKQQLSKLKHAKKKKRWKANTCIPILEWCNVHRHGNIWRHNEANKTLFYWLNLLYIKRFGSKQHSYGGRDVSDWNRWCISWMNVTLSCFRNIWLIFSALSTSCYHLPHAKCFQTVSLVDHRTYTWGNSETIQAQHHSLMFYKNHK